MLAALMALFALAGTDAQRAGRPSILEASLRSILELNRLGRMEPVDQRQVLPEYDFIVVGAGTAGCVLANRLSAVAGWKVLLIEAGREENYMMDIPIVANMLQFSEANWKYRTVPSDKACLGMANRQCNYPRGKVCADPADPADPGQRGQGSRRDLITVFQCRGGRGAATHRHVRPDRAWPPPGDPVN